MNAIQKTAATLTLALTVSAALAPAAHAGYWDIYCDFSGCWEVYVPTCGWVTDGWNWYEVCG